jgi:branched-subunit amino acid aminotransferase/4-amino-4-deoxychorismate lyase
MTTTTIKTTSCNRNGTHLRVLIAVPVDQIDTIQVHRIADDLALHTTRLVVLAAPTVEDLDRHTERLQSSARIVNWELVSADGVHNEIISALANHRTVEP